MSQQRMLGLLGDHPQWTELLTTPWARPHIDLMEGKGFIVSRFQVIILCVFYNVVGNASDMIICVFYA